MGHIVDYCEFSTTTSKSEIYAEMSARANHDGDGLPNDISYEERIFDTYDEAYHYLDNLKGWYVCRAVKYRELPHAEMVSKTLTTLRERKEREIDKREAYAKAHAVRAFKAEFVGCAECGSKLAKARLWGNECPLCRTDLRGKTTLETIAKYNANIAEIEAKIKAEEKAITVKNAKKTKLMWLVRIEYHC